MSFKNTLLSYSTGGNLKSVGINEAKTPETNGYQTGTYILPVSGMVVVGRR